MRPRFEQFPLSNDPVAAPNEFRLEQMSAGIVKFEFSKDVAAAAFYAG